MVTVIWGLECAGFVSESNLLLLICTEGTPLLKIVQVPDILHKVLTAVFRGARVRINFPYYIYMSTSDYVIHPRIINI